MNFNKRLFFLFFLVFILGISCVSANGLEDNITAITDESPIEIVDNISSVSVESPIETVDNIDCANEDSNRNYSNVLQASSQEVIQSGEDVIVVNDWNELQYYCAQTDKDYTLKLKENTNFYPSNMNDENQQIKFKNNVKIIGSEGSWIGDSSSNANHLKFLAMQIEDNTKVGITLVNITFKWISAGGGTKLPDGIFLRLGGKKESIIVNCSFTDSLTKYGHSCLVHLKKGTLTFDNCSFTNCTDSFGVLSVYGSYPHMIVKNCYFENNYASTEPGCINNCGKLTVYNTTFVKNRSFWWAGAIHTHGGGNTTIYDSAFIDNVAGWNGGALYTYAYLQVYNSVFIGNNCTTDNGGGAIGACSYQSDPHIYIEHCLFKDNTNNCWSTDELSNDFGKGGAIALMDAGSLTVLDTTFVANSAAFGSAIRAVAVAAYGSPDVIISNNSFINHTRYNDVLVVKVDGTILNISDNYFEGNSIVFSNLTLTKLREGKEQATLQINASLKNPSYYDEDILDKTLYDVYINNKYVKTVNSTVFTVDFGDLDICDVYVIPTISNRKSNEVTITSTREYVFVSKSTGNDSNNGISRNTPVNTIKRALELANVCQNIILLDGDYSETDIQIDYGVTIKGEGNATLTDTTSFISNANFTLKNLKISNLNTENFIKQNKDNLVISNCIFTNNAAVLVNNSGFTSLTNSILLNNSKIVDGNINDCVLDYNWWGNVPSDLSNYITLNLTSNVNALENNQKANVKAVFYLNDGSKYTNLPDINLDVTVLNGVSSHSTVNIDSSFIYTLTAFDDGVLTLTYNNVNVSKCFEFLKSHPGISLETNDIMFGDNVVITVTTPGDAEGNLTVNVGNISQTKVIQSAKSTFTFENLKADTYTIALTYTGDKKYISKELISTVNVNKYESSTQLNLSTVNVGEDVIITITTITTSTGNVTLSINDNVQTLTLTDSKANFTIKNIKRGDYLIRVVYNGDDKYLTSQDSKFIEVDNLNATMSIKTEDITYGDLAVIKVTLNDDATGNITITIDGKSNQSKVSNGKAEVTFTNLDAGSNKNISVFYTGDDTYFNLTNTSTFNIAKADLTFSISSGDIKIGQFAEIVITVPSKTTGTFTIGEDVINIPMSGEISYVISDLEIGSYTYTATYNGNNYYTVSKTISFTVSEYPIPQVQNEGFNTKNTHKSQYETITNGNIAFAIQFNETLSGDLVIDSFGNVYVPIQSGIYAFNQTSKLWYFTSTAAAGNLSGVAISRDVIIAPKSGDTLYFINQTSGERWGESNIYQGSSFFAPVVDDSATLYIASEYQFTSEDYKLTIVPYKLWEKGGDPTLISIGNTMPLCSPTLNENIIVVVSDNRLRIIDAKSLQTIAIKSGNYLPVRPIIGEGNIVYALLSDSVVAYNSNGVQVWKTKVTGGVGSTITLDNEQGLYHVNAKGIIYKYDIVDGTQSKFSNLKVTSGILIDANNNLYFGSNNIFYALDSEGNVLWKSDLDSKIIGNPVMDASGLIYVPTENSITALIYAPLSDPVLKVSVDDIVEGQKATITITWNNQTTGSVSYNVNGEDVTVDAGDAKITKVISGLSAGYYDVSVSYLGDMRFKESTVTKTFAVRSTDDVANNIQFDGNQTFTFSLNNAQGNLTVNVAGKTYNKALINGQTSITIDKLSPGDWDAVVTYSGDRQFNRANRTFIIEIPKYSIELNEVIATENIVSRISVSLPGDATGNLTLSVGTKKYTQTITAGNAVIIVDDLAAGNYTATLAYSGDSNYESVSKQVSICPTKIPIILDDNNVIVESGLEPKVSIKLDANATGRFTININGDEYSADISEDLIISDLEPGNYTGTLTYSGDKKYDKASYVIGFEVPNSTVIDNSTNSSADNTTVENKTETSISAEQIAFNQGNDSIIEVTIPDVNSGIVLVDVAGKKFYGEISNGKANVTIAGVAEGNYTAYIKFLGDGKYKQATTTADVKVSEDKIITELKQQLEEAQNKVDNLTSELTDAKDNVTQLKEDLADANSRVDNLTSELSDAKDNVTQLKEDLADANSRVDNLTSELANVGKVVKLGSQFNVTEGTTFATYAVETGIGEKGALYAFVLRDSNGKPIANATVTFAYKTVVFNSTTDENGTLYLGISTYLAQDALCAMSYVGDETHNATFVAFNFKIQKKTTAITAAAKTYKVSKKNKYLTVSLKTIKGASRDGKTYLKKGKKITLTVNGKTYVGYTNANGKVTFKITNLNKKGKYTAVIKFAGSDTYAGAKTKVKLKVK